MHKDLLLIDSYVKNKYWIENFELIQLQTLSHHSPCPHHAVSVTELPKIIAQVIENSQKSILLEKVAIASRISAVTFCLA